MEVRKVGFSDAQKEKLRKSVGFKIRNDFLYVPLAFREKKDGEYIIPKEQWTIFKLRGLMGIDQSKIGDDLFNDIVYSKTGEIEKLRLNTSTLNLNTCRRGIISAKNFYNEDFEVVDFPKVDELTNLLPDSALNLLRPELISELANVILGHSILTEEELLGLEY